jgi:WD40 repeat protein
LWEVDTGNLLRAFGGQNYGERAFSASLSPDANYIVALNDDMTIKLWDTATGALTKTLTAHTSSVSAVAFSVDGRYVASSAGYDPIKLWDVRTGNFVRAFSVEPHGNYSTFSFSPKGRFIAAPAFDGIRLWDVASGTYLNLLKPQTGTVGGKLLFSNDKKIKLWEIASGALVKSIEVPIAEVNAAAFSPDASQIALGGSFGLKLYETATGNFVKNFEGQPGSEYPLRISFSSDGRYIVCTVRDQKIRIWEVATGGNVYTYDHEFLPNRVSYPSNLIPIAISSDSQYIASGTDDGSVILWYARGLSTSVAAMPNLGVSDFTLSQNYPNPFNPSTTIEFSIPQTRFVTLKIYNTLGDEMATLVAANFSAGRHQVVWNANDIAGGIYFYRLQAGGLVQAQKLVVVK